MISLKIKICNLEGIILKRILVIGIGGYNNFGDEAMFVELSRKIQQESEVEITAAYYNYDITKAKKRFPNINFIKLRSIHRRFGLFRKIFMDISSRFYAKKYDCIYFPGGGNLTSLYSGYIEDAYLLVKYFSKENKNIIFRPQSVGPFNGTSQNKDEMFVKQIANLSNEFYVREYFSYEYMKNINKGVKLLHDDAWDIKEIKPENFLEDELKNKKLVGLSIRPFNVENNYLENWFEELVDNLVNNGYTPFFIPICYNEDSPEYQDNYFLKSIIKDKGIFLEDIIDIKSLGPGNIKYFVSLCEKCIGLSYHFNVFSLSLNKKVVSLYYEDYYKIKNVGLQKAFGDVNNVVNPLDTEVEEVINLLENRAQVVLN